MVDQARARKLGDRIAQIVAEMLERRIKDPRLGFVTVTEARLTGDLREATVFYTVYGSARGAGRHRGRAGQRDRGDPVRGRPPDRAEAHPSLTFVADTVPESARHMEDLVARAREADAALAAVREGAVPAGDPDPYRELPGEPGTAGRADPTATGRATSAGQHRLPAGPS